MSIHESRRGVDSSLTVRFPTVVVSAGPRTADDLCGRSMVQPLQPLLAVTANKGLLTNA